MEQSRYNRIGFPRQFPATRRLGLGKTKGSPSKMTETPNFLENRSSKASRFCQLSAESSTSAIS